MMWLWIQSLVLIGVTFAIGLWLGHVVYVLTRGAARLEPTPVATFEDEPPYQPYHGYDQQPEPLPVVAEPPAPRYEPPAPPRRIKPALLFPINQFGIVTVTQAPAI